MHPRARQLLPCPGLPRGLRDHRPAVLTPELLAAGLAAKPVRGRSARDPTIRSIPQIDLERRLPTRRTAQAQQMKHEQDAAHERGHDRDGHDREQPEVVVQAAFSSDSSTPCFQSHSTQRSVVPLLFSFLTTNLAWQIGHGCGTGLSHATKSHCFFAQFEQP
jgi:hypothetical protein